jgi:predicted DNA-binding transcriptional regulator AlpA
VAPLVHSEDLIDAQEVAEILGLTHADMPRLVMERGGGRTKLWLRVAIEAWAGTRRTN